MLSLRTAARQAGQQLAKRATGVAAPAIAVVAAQPYSVLARPAQTTGRQQRTAAPLPRASTLSFPSSAIRHFSIETTKVPSLGDSISEGTIVKWEANVGDFVDADGVLVVIETDKVSVDIRSPKAGVLKAQLVKAGETVKVGQEISQLDTEGKKPAGSAAPAAAAPKAAAAAPAAAAPKAAPAAAAPAAAAAAAPKAAAAAPAAAPKPTVAPPAPGSRTERKVPMTRMRQTIANRLKVAQNTAACLTTFNEIDMTNIMALRNKYKDDFLEKHGAKLGFMSVFVKAATAALIKNPDVNAYLQDGNLVYHDYVDISVAVSTGTGLVVPVLRNTESMNFAQVESAIAAYGSKAKKGQIAMEDMVGGTFTISNGGVFGSMFGTPILNPPQSAILGMHGIFQRPVAIDGKVEIRPMMYVALTYDHRVIDGSGAVTFLKDIKNAVEDPARLVLDL